MRNSLYGVRFNGITAVKRKPQILSIVPTSLCQLCRCFFYDSKWKKTFNTTAEKADLRKYDRQSDRDRQLFNIVTSCCPDGVDRLLVCHCLLITVTLVSVRVIAKW